jgi:hypothetical protein
MFADKAEARMISRKWSTMLLFSAGLSLQTVVVGEGNDGIQQRDDSELSDKRTKVPPRVTWVLPDQDKKERPRKVWYEDTATSLYKLACRSRVGSTRRRAALKRALGLATFSECKGFAEQLSQANHYEDANECWKEAWEKGEDISVWEGLKIRVEIVKTWLLGPFSSCDI